jgi:hypothetical protein
LPEILAVILCGTLAGAEDFVEIERWARQKLDFLRRRAEGSAGDVAGLPLHSPHQQTVATDNLIKGEPAAHSGKQNADNERGNQDWRFFHVFRLNGRAKRAESM